MAIKDKSADTAAFKKLKKDIKEESIQKLYIFHGVEHYLRDHYLEQIKQKLLPDGMEHFNFHTLTEKTFSLNKLSELVDGLPMMSARTVIVVSDVDLFKLNEDGRRTISELFETLPDYVCLIFLYDLIDYKSDGRIKKLASAIKTHAQVVNFARQNANDLSDWIARRFKALNHTITRDDAQYLIFLCGDLMTGLISEIEKIGAFATKTQVTRADIDTVAIPQLDAVVFQMTDALAKKDFPKTYEVLGDLLSMQEEPIMILAVLGKHFRQLLTARIAFSKGLDAQYLMKLWEMRSSYPAQKMMSNCRHYSIGWYQKAILLCMETDLEIKSVIGLDSKDALISLLVTLSVEEKVS